MNKRTQLKPLNPYEIKVKGILWFNSQQFIAFNKIKGKGQRR